MDAIHLVRTHILAQNSNPVAWFTLRLTQIVACIQVCRGYCFIIILATVLGHLFLQCIDTVDKTCENILQRDLAKVDRYLNGYNAMRIVNTMVRSETGGGTCFGMLIGILVCVFLNYGSIKLPSVLPTLPLICCLMLSVPAPACLRLMLPMLVAAYEDGKSIMEKWKYLVAETDNRKYLVRRLKGIRLIYIEGILFDFRIYRCDKSIKATYYYAILDYTITALMAIDNRWFIY